MPRKRRKLKTRIALDIPSEVLNWLNGTSMKECSAETRASRYFFWCDFAGGLQGLVDYCQQNGLMPKAIPPEVVQALKSEPKVNIQ